MLGSMEIRDVEFTWVGTIPTEWAALGRRSTTTGVDGMLSGGIIKSEFKLGEPPLVSTGGSGYCEITDTNEDRSGGAYVYYWPRNSPNVPDNVKVSPTAAA